MKMKLNTYVDSIIAVLVENDNHPLHYEDITRRIAAKYSTVLARLDTPEQSVNANITTKKDLFDRVIGAPGEKFLTAKGLQRATELPSALFPQISSLAKALIQRG